MECYGLAILLEHHGEPLQGVSILLTHYLIYIVNQ